jgi:hypothetical protein
VIRDLFNEASRLLTLVAQGIDKNGGHGGGMRITVFIVAFVCATALLLSQGRSFAGEIMDSQCAGMHSHSSMMQGVNAKTAKECTEKCVHQFGGKYVLFDSSSNTAYQLDNQEKPAAFAGQKVTVKGTYDAASKTIHVESIESR